MRREDILAQLKEIISLNFELPIELISPQSQFRANLGMDSLALVDLTFFVKHSFGIDEKLNKYQSLLSVDDLVDFIHAHLNAQVQP